LSLGYACLLVVFVSTTPGEGTLGKWVESRTARALAYIGTFSYSIYIWHLDFIMHPIQRACDNGWLNGLPGTVRWPLMMLLYITTAIVVGILTAKLVERPSLVLRDRLFPTRADALGSEAREGGLPQEEAVAAAANSSLVET
ncbi:MAG TPA: hypothetical protein VKU00_31415, partial [Chthonomonadaceae bacterium]|nr:hypothetical protein [Chthonomonadaceae bacterium]